MNNTSETVDILRKNRLFVDITEDVLLKISDIVSPMSIKQDAFIYRKGDEVDGLFLVVSGEVKIIAERGYESYVLSHATETYLFGEFLLKGISIRSTSAQALVDTELFFLPRDQFNSFIQDKPIEGASIASRIVDRLCWNQTILALRLSHLFVGLDDNIVRALIHSMKVESIASKTILIKQNTTNNALWVIVDGQFKITRINKEGQCKKLGLLGRGEVIGEVSVICDTPRSSSVIATRDSTIAKLTRESYEGLLKRYPIEINQTFVKSVISHLRQDYSNKVHLADTFALVFLSPELIETEISAQLVGALNTYGSTVSITSDDVDLAFSDPGMAQTFSGHPMNSALLQWISELENAHQYIIYTVDNSLSNWSKRCLRHADHIIFCASADDSPEIGSLEKLVLGEIQDDSIKKSLILIHPESTQVPKNSSHWLAHREMSLYHHVKENYKPDFGKVSRFLTGNAIGLVLGGGGARGFAHIGVIRAFKELNIPIDLIGGNSMGAVLAAQYAMQWDFSKMLEKTKLLCLSGDRITLPIMSIYSGKRMTAGLFEMLGDVCIEDLWVKFFSISCNISRATVMTHDKGELLAAVLNSNAPPGIFPPQVVNGDLLVDGALLNNVPVDVMAKMNEGGTIIAVDVSVREDLLNNTDNSGGVSGWSLLLNKINPMADKKKTPSILEILSRASIIGGLAQRKKLMNGVADLYLKPKLNEFSFNAYKHAEKIEQVGYEYAKKELTQWLIDKNN